MQITDNKAWQMTINRRHLDSDLIKMQNITDIYIGIHDKKATQVSKSVTRPTMSETVGTSPVMTIYVSLSLRTWQFLASLIGHPMTDDIYSRNHFADGSPQIDSKEAMRRESHVTCVSRYPCTTL
jgi:hypothetical protein